MIIGEDGNIWHISGKLMFIVGKSYDIIFDGKDEKILDESGEVRWYRPSGIPTFKEKGYKKVKFEVSTENNIIIMSDGE